MDPLTLGLLGGGSLLAQIGGGIFSASSERKAADASRRAMEEAARQAKADLAAMSAEERERYLIAAKRAEADAAQAERQARARTEQSLFQLFSSPQYQGAAEYITKYFAQGIPESLAREYSGRIQQAQASRGLEYGGAAGRDEAALLTKMAEEGRMNLLPQLKQLAYDPMQAYQSALGFELGATQGVQNLGLAQIQSVMQGLQAAQGIASAQAAGSQYGMSAALNSPYSAASPLANTLFGLGSGGMSLLQILALQGSAGGGSASPTGTMAIPSTSSLAGYYGGMGNYAFA